MSNINNILDNEQGLTVRQKLNILVALYNAVIESDPSFNLIRIKENFIKANSPTGKFLKDDGTWSEAAYTLAQILANGAKTGGIRIKSDNSDSFLDIRDDGFEFGRNGDSSVYITDGLIVIDGVEIKLQGTSTVNGDIIASQNYVNNAIIGLLDDRGNYDASSNLFPSAGGSGTAGAIMKGDLWTISISGTLGGVVVTVGDVIRSLVDSPSQITTNWVITENNLGYVPENASKKGVANGYASLDVTGKVPVSQMQLAPANNLFNYYNFI